MGDDTINVEGSDEIGEGQFSWTDSMKAIYKLKDVIKMRPEGMDEGMKSNKPYWQVIFNHPLTYIFLFMGIVIAILASVTRKNRN
jgi:hypothetical protein